MHSMSRLGLVGSFALALACGGGSQGDEGSGSSSDTDTTTTGTTATVTTAVTATGMTTTLTSATTTVGTTTSPPGEPCCAPQGGPGCAEDPAIADCVCETDRYCCETNWDDVCVSRVVELGCGVCDPGPITTSPDTGDVTTGVPPDNVGPCCETHPETGCEVQSVSECVCNYLPECCDDAWRDVCVGAVDGFGCGVCPHGTETTSTTGLPPDNSEACCTTHASTGCEYPAIADCVCTSYPGCCADGWDQTCVDAVDTLGCGVCPP
jgi:hypothetical protein